MNERQLDRFSCVKVLQRDVTSLWGMLGSIKDLALHYHTEQE